MRIPATSKDSARRVSNLPGMDSPARFLAETINPLLVGLILAAPGPPTRAAGTFWGRCAVAVGLAVLLAEAGKKWEVWHGHSGFPSGHATLAAACATCLILRDRRWAALSVPATALMAWALVAARYHDVPDVVGALVLGPAVAALVLRAAR